MLRLFIFLFLIISSCKNLDLLTLYDVEIKNTEGINGFTSTEIFTTGGSDEVWGMSGKDEFCNPFRFSSFDASVNYSKINEAASAQVKSSNSVSVDRKYNLPTVKIKDRK